MEQNKEGQLQLAEIEKNKKKCKFEHVAKFISFNENQIKQNYDIICLFANSTMRIYSYKYIVHAINPMVVISESSIYSYQFSFSPDIARNFPGFGIVVGSFSGTIMIFANFMDTHVLGDEV